MKINSWYDWRLFLTRFTIVGLLGFVVEVIFTGLDRFFQVSTIYGLDYALLNLGFATKADTGIMAFFVYCWAAIPFTFLLPPLQEKLGMNWKGTLIRAGILGLIFMAIEFGVGFLILSLNGWNYLNVWDYRHLPLNILGIVTFTFYPFWFLAGLIGEWIHDRLLQIDDILVNDPVGMAESTKDELRLKDEARRASLHVTKE